MSWPISNNSSATSEMDDARPQSFEELVAENYPFVWRVLRGLGLSRTDAEDAAQEVFLIAARKQSSIAPDRARSFLYGTALRVANNAKRRLGRRREVTERSDDGDDVFAGASDPEQSTELVRARQLLGELLAKVPDKLRRVLILAEIAELEVSEIATLERVPVGTAASRLRLGRARLRELLEAARDRNPFGSSA